MEMDVSFRLHKYDREALAKREIRLLSMPIKGAH
jgi:hypothetical protein